MARRGTSVRECASVETRLYTRCDVMCDEAVMCRNRECDVDGSLMGSRCHTSGMRIQSHAGVTLLPVYMPWVRTLRPDHLRSDLREPSHQPRGVARHRSTYDPARVFLSFFPFPSPHCPPASSNAVDVSRRSIPPNN